MTENYGDEEIVRQLNLYKKGVYGTIYDGLYIKGDLHHFVKQNLFQNRMSIYIPLRFDKMETSDIRKKYIIDIPDIVYKNTKDTINITFRYVKEKIEKDKIQEILELGKKYIKKLNGNCLFFEHAIFSYRNNCIGWIDYKIDGLYGSFYIMFYVIPIKENCITGKFICEYRKAILWKSVMLQMLETIEIKEDD